MSKFNQQAFHDACCQGERTWMKDQGLGAALEIERLREELEKIAAINPDDEEGPGGLHYELTRAVKTARAALTKVKP